MDNTARLLTDLTMHPQHRNADSGLRHTWDRAHEETAILPDGRPVTRRCTRDYAFLVTVLHEGEWFPFRWVTTKPNLKDAVNAAKEAGYDQVETVPVMGEHGTEV